jgi:hypothetical protein
MSLSRYQFNTNCAFLSTNFFTNTGTIREYQLDEGNAFSMLTPLQTTTDLVGKALLLDVERTWERTPVLVARVLGSSSDLAGE